MGFLDRLFGNEKAEARDGQPGESGTRKVADPATPASVTDAQALERYRYMMKTAPPDTIEQAHAEAFAKLTPEQRRQVLAELANAAPLEERAAAQATSPDDPRAMGRLATRTEMRQPGFMERTFGGGGMGMGLGGGSLLGSFAMGFLGSMVAQSFFSSMGMGMGGFGGGEALAGTDADVAGDQNADANTDADADPTDPDMETEVDDADMDVSDMDMGGGDFDV
jgi:hypothetical protein